MIEELDENKTITEKVNVTPKIQMDTGQSGDDFSIGIRNERKNRFVNQSVQVNTEKSQKFGLDVEIQRLLDEKNGLENSIKNLKILLAGPEFFNEKSDDKEKNQEFEASKSLIDRFKEMLLARDVKNSELERENTDIKALLQETQLENKQKSLDSLEKDKKIENLFKELEFFRNSSNIRSFEEVSEREFKKESISHERFTETTRFGSDVIPNESTYDKISYLNKELEYSKEITDRLLEKIQNLEAKNKNFEEKSKNFENTITKLKKDLETITKGSEKGSKSNPSPGEESTDMDLLRKNNEEAIIQLELQKQTLEVAIMSYKESLKDFENFKEIKEDRERLFQDLNNTKDELKAAQDQLNDAVSQFSKQKVDWDYERSDNNYIKTMLTRELDSVKSKLLSQEETFNAESLKLTRKIEKINDKLKFYKAECEIARKEVEKLRNMHEILKDQLIDKQPESEEIKLSAKRYYEVIGIKEKKMEESLEDLNENFASILAEKEELRKNLAEKENIIKELSEECQKMTKELVSIKEKKNTSQPSSEKIIESENISLISESSSNNSYMSIQELLIIENLAEIDVRTNPLLETVSNMRKESAMVYSNV